MSLKITHKYSSASGTPPAAGDIDVGEIAINAADAELYTKDSAGNVRKFQNTTTGTADGVQFTQTGTGAAQRTVESKLQDVVSVKDFGAVGNGVVDDRAAIQAAFDASLSVHFPEGIYYQGSSSLIFRSGHHITGSNAVLTCDTGVELNQLQNATGALEDVFISGLTFEGPTAASARTNGVCVYVGNSATNIKVVGCVFKRFTSGGIYLNNATASTITSNVFRSSTSRGTEYTENANDITLSGSSERNVITGNHCYSNGHIAIIVKTSDDVADVMKSNVISNNVIKSYKGYGITVYRTNVSQTCVDNLISDNSVEDITGESQNSNNAPQPFIYGTGIYVQGTDNTVVTGNTVRNTNQQTASETLSPACISTISSNGSVIANNICDTSGKRCIQIKLSDNSVVTGNIANNAGDDGIRIVNSTNAIINDNSIDSPTNNGINVSYTTVTTGHNLAVANNLIKDTGASGINFPLLDEAYVSGNFIENAGVFGIAANAVTNTLFEGNRVRNSGNIGFRCNGTDSTVTLSSNTVSGGSSDDFNLSAPCLVLPGNYGEFTGAYSPFRTLTQNSSTPSVESAISVRIANSVATTITDFAEGYEGQTFTAFFANNNTVIDFTQSTLMGNGQASWSATLNDSMSCTLRDGVWYCLIST